MILYSPVLMLLLAVQLVHLMLNPAQGKTMKRFYKLVSTQKVDGGYHILLDGRPVKAKSGVPLSCLNEEVAQCVMQEWAAQQDHIDPDTMPFTQIENTRLDRVSKERTAMTPHILKYLDTDLLCYVVDAHEALVQMQEEKWTKWRTWFETHFDTKLQTTTGLAALTQDTKAHEAVAKEVNALDDAQFTILQIITPLSGSLILALAFVMGAAKAQDVFDATFLEEDFKGTLYDAEKYGIDPLLEKQQKGAQQDLNAAQEYLSLI